MTNQEKFIEVFGLNIWLQIIVESDNAERFKDFWTSPFSLAR